MLFLILLSSEPDCHPERSEGSLPTRPNLAHEILRCAQDDSVAQDDGVAQDEGAAQDDIKLSITKTSNPSTLY